ncbi:MAG TPA: hypothetical protein VNQ55_09395, partial [Parapedobacter sp.]|nr:hypothetical protein [Parapedobacter sp.]
MMRRYYLFFWFMLIIGYAMAQPATDSLHHRKIYVTSGMGWGFALGETNDVLQAKFSNSLGLDISLANRHYFLYPSIDFLTFRYNQQVPD